MERVPDHLGTVFQFAEWVLTYAIDDGQRVLGAAAREEQGGEKEEISGHEDRCSRFKMCSNGMLRPKSKCIDEKRAI